MSCLPVFRNWQVRCGRIDCPKCRISTDNKFLAGYTSNCLIISTATAAYAASTHFGAKHFHCRRLLHTVWLD